MTLFQKILLIYFVVTNVVTFLTFGIDKWNAKHSRRRIRETALLLLAVLGGSIGAWLGMKAWHHKTKHKKFQLGIPIIFVFHLTIIAFLIIKGLI
ncbi:MAG: DUF1294 domain-containing protein [Bacteroidaceae bacterium]|nr:DUF1294 domain-containing protein [Bacteroidaceae bacterium]